ncbi:MAG: hypothetical protein KatS3mg121_0171 [Gammaproteobacteria bacterium]|nr:MAG: hypothetical protein KatS3mg121_0171 [Gammaproteobacteria bacterium]
MFEPSVVQLDAALDFAERCLAVTDRPGFEAVLGRLAGLIEYHWLAVVHLAGDAQRARPKAVRWLVHAPRARAPCSERELSERARRFAPPAAVHGASAVLPRPACGTAGALLWRRHEAGWTALYFAGTAARDGGALLLRLAPHLDAAFRRVLPASTHAPVLTAREREVLLWLSEGKSVWEMARILHISEHTVKYHLARLYRKLGASNRVQALRSALARGWLNAPPIERRA